MFRVSTCSTKQTFGIFGWSWPGLKAFSAVNERSGLEQLPGNYPLCFQIALLTSQMQEMSSVYQCVCVSLWPQWQEWSQWQSQLPFQGEIEPRIERESSLGTSAANISASETKSASWPRPICSHLSALLSHEVVLFLTRGIAILFDVKICKTI